jgi:lipopolysaccharide/colanic/teichoic acid biosynthesis glycosyltransferase
MTLGVVGLVVYFLKVSEEFSRIMFGTGALIALLILPIMRYLSAISMRRFMGQIIQNEVLIEDGLTFGSASDRVVLNADRDNLKPLLQDPMLLDRLGHCLRHADRVIVACPAHRRAVWAMALKGADVEAEVLAPELDELGVLDFGRVGDRRTFVVASGPLGRVDQMLKRALDLSLVLVSLPLFLPIMLLVALAVKVESRGPILFKQQRVGLGNRLFIVYKFRSMYVDRLDGAGTRSTDRDDDRVTRVGRFIRRTSLDEIPQIFNVLVGTMSIVGPRPHALGSTAEEKLFWDIDTSYWHRHAVKPGITGLAQIQGFRGATLREGDLRDRLEADLQYVNGWTIWRDMRIIMATFRVLVHKNAF